MITTVCKISYGSQTVPPIVPAVQGDTGRAISFEIADFTPPAGATATYFILKPSGEAIYNSATITDNSILCELTAQSLAEAGENRMQVRVLQGENIVTSFEVILMVRAFLGDDAMESGTEMNIFDQAVAHATEQFQENAEQIVAEVIESIPSDYTTLTEEVDELNERLDNDVDGLNNKIDSRFYDSSNLFDLAQAEVGLIRASDGAVISTYTGFTTTGLMPAEYLDIIRFQFTLVSNNIRYDLENTTAVNLVNLCYYDEDKNFIAGSQDTISNYITVAEPTAKYIRVSINDNLFDTPVVTNIMFVKSNANGVLLPYEAYAKKILKDSVNTPYLTKGKTQYNLYRGTYSEKIKLSNINTSAKSVLLSCKADLTSFDNVEIGLGKANSVVVSVVVDDTNIVVTDTRFGGSTVITHTFTHGLTVANEIGVQLFIMNTGIGFVTVSSNGRQYKTSNINIIRANLGVPYFKATSTISNVDFSCTFPALNKDIWVFGDSYLQQTDSRWIYYMNQNEYDTFCTDAYSGENSADAYIGLNTLLAYGKPKYLVWCLGMNDGSDTNELPNATWKKYVTAVQEICNSYNIELVMATIPTVPSINHEYKNTYIRNSGYKYIDFAKAVGAQADGTWYTGMLSSDNVHPDVAGGIALYNQAITDFPQFAIK